MKSLVAGRKTLALKNMSMAVGTVQLFKKTETALRGCPIYEALGIDRSGQVAMQVPSLKHGKKSSCMPVLPVPQRIFANRSSCSDCN
jgi:hypothetical protein